MFLFTGCYEEYNFIKNTRQLPPRFFKIPSKQRMDTILFETQRFSFRFPTVKEIDFKNNRMWEGATSQMGNSISVFNGLYHISISTSYSPSKYGESDRAIENGTKKFRPQRTKTNGDIININTHIEYYGRENYPCVVSEHIDRFDRYRISYRCYKFNLKRTKSKNVLIRLTYSKPIDPILAQEYTYEDLKQRAKRMLDSLYITDKW